MGDRPLVDPSVSTLHYATPVQRLKRVRALPALFGGMFLVIVSAFTLIVGFVVGAEYRSSMTSDFSTALAVAVCIFSATCLFAGLPLIYRGTRADERIE
jgi:hypothetical protein